MSRVPHVPREKLIAAMKEFDRHLRNTRAWENWEQNKVHLFAIKYKGDFYPVKRIISMATGFPVSEFRGGLESNRYIEQRCGPCIVPHPSQST